MTDEAGATVDAPEENSDAVKAIAEMLGDEVLEGYPEADDTDGTVEAEEPVDAEPAEEPAAEEEEPAEDEKEEEPAEEDEPEDDGPWDETRIKTEREKLETERAEQEKQLLQYANAAKRREYKSRKREKETQALLEQNKSTREAMAADMHTLQTGTAEEVVRVLGRITRQEPRALLEKIVNNMAEDGTPQEDPRLAKMEKELEALRTKEQTTVKQQALQTEIRESQKQIFLGAQSEKHFPYLAKLTGQSPDMLTDTCQKIQTYMVTEYEERGRNIDVHTALIEAEYELASREKNSPAPAAENSGREPRGNSKPAKRQPTVTPSTAALTSGRKRELTDNERIDAIARLIPDV